MARAVTAREERAMDIELLYFDGCSTWKDTLVDRRAALAEAGRDDEVRLVNVDSQEAAERLRFLGSPTVRVDGRDIESDIPAEGYGMECRIYWVDGKPVGLPPREWLARAVAAG